MKNFLLSILVIALSFTATAQNKTYYYGDFNNDGQLTMSDVVYLTEIILGRQDPVLMSGEYKEYKRAEQCLLGETGVKKWTWASGIG